MFAVMRNERVGFVMVLGVSGWNLELVGVCVLLERIISGICFECELFA